MSHINIGRAVWPRAQVIFWREWKGLRWHRWQGKMGVLFRGSLILGWIEIRIWRAAGGE